MLFGQYFDMNLSANVQLQTISLAKPAPTLTDRIQLARFRLHALPVDGGYKFISMLAATDAAFTAAYLRHFQQLADDAVIGPYLQPPNVIRSTSLFSDPFQSAYTQLW